MTLRVGVTRRGQERRLRNGAPQREIRTLTLTVPSSLVMCGGHDVDEGDKVLRLATQNLHC